LEKRQTDFTSTGSIATVGYIGSTATVAIGVSVVVCSITATDGCHPPRDNFDEADGVTIRVAMTVVIKLSLLNISFNQHTLC
jgi:hypothetical protein